MKRKIRVASARTPLWLLKFTLSYLVAVLIVPPAARGDCVGWVQRTDVGTPGIRTSPTMAFDSVHGVTVFFGGETTNGSGGRINPTDTWEYNGSNWYAVTITGSSPPGRSYQAMAYDSVSGQVMLCGGQNSGGILKDTWFYVSHGNGTGTWTQGANFDTVGRTGLSMAFDSSRGVMVVTGGMSDMNGTANELYGTLQPTTFEWNGSAWSFGTSFPAIFGSSQSGIARHATCFDANEGYVILGGGTVPAYSLAPPSPCTGPFYEFPNNFVEGYATNLPGWMEIANANVTDCGGFSQSAIAYDSRRKLSVLYGGSSLVGNQYVPTTYEYPSVNPVSSQGAVNQWNPRSLSPQPTMPRLRHAMAYDSRRGVVVLFGGENGSGTPYGDTWELDPNLPTFTLTATNVTVCQGSGATISTSISGSGSFLFQWQHNGVNVTNSSRISGATNFSPLVISSVTTNDAGTYVLTYIDTCDNSGSSAAVALVVDFPPIITNITPGLALCPGDSGSLDVFYTSPLPASYQWAFNGLPLSGQTNQLLNFVGATSNQSGFYAVTVSNSCGGTLSASVPVSVGVWVKTPPSPTTTATLCEPVTISALARGKGNLTAQWFRNGTLIVPDSRVTSTSVLQFSGDTLLSLNFADAKYQDDGSYIVAISDSCGPVTNGPFRLSVQPDPAWLVVATNGPVARWDAAMVYDSDRRVSVLFGGQLYSPSAPVLTNDTWEFDGTNWTQRFPATLPLARSQSQMVYDSHRHKTVLFGGMTNGPSSSGYPLDTWEWNGTNWAKIAPPHTPGFAAQPGYTFANCFDSLHNEMLVFGDAPGSVSQLWGYDGTDWTLKSPLGSAPVYTAVCSTMAFDTNRGRAVLLGAAQSASGNGNSSGYSVWEWDGTIWHEQLQSGQIPFLDFTGNQVAYDTFRQECVLYGYEPGTTGGTTYPYPDDYRYIYRWNGAQWIADLPTPTSGVSFHIHHSMVFDSARNALTVFGGLQDSGGPDTNFTYEILYQDDPAVIRQPTIQVSMLGQEVQLYVLAAGALPISYQWQKSGVNLTDGGAISGSQTNTLTINPAAVGNSGQYQLVMSNICGLAMSQPIQLTLTTTPLSIVVSGTSVTITWTDTNAVLQSAPNLTGPWTTIVGAMSPYKTSTTGPKLYYRLLHP